MFHGPRKLHLFFDDGIRGLYCWGAARADGKSCFRLRYLPGRLSVEPARADFNDSAVPAESVSLRRRKRPRDGSAASRRIALPSKIGMASRTFRNNVSRTLPRKPRQTYQMAWADAQCLHRTREFRFAARNDGL